MIIRRRRLVSSVSNHDASQNNTMILPMLTSTSAAASSNQVNIVSHDATLLGKFVAMIHVKMHANETHSRNAGGTTGASQRPKQTNPTVPPKNASTNATVRVKSSMRIVLRSTIKCPGKFACDTSWNVRLRHASWKVRTLLRSSPQPEPMPRGRNLESLLGDACKTLKR